MAIGQERVKVELRAPNNASSILLHSCCGPCSSAIIEALLDNGIRPTVFYYNPNIYPLKEYELRKSENRRYAQSLGLEFVDADYDHAEWLAEASPLRDEPERGARCLSCFRLRLARAARYAHEKGFSVFATTLASSRWKDLEQISEAGRYAAGLAHGLTFWERNWRKNGLGERRNQLIKTYNFYNQQYCGCEYSLRDANAWRARTGKPLIDR